MTQKSPVAAKFAIDRRVGRARSRRAKQTDRPLEALASAEVALGEETAEAAPAFPRYLPQIASVGLFLLVLLYALHVGRAAVLPVVLAIVLSLILWPPVRALKRWHVPESLGSLIVLAAIAGIIGSAGYQLSGPASAWIQWAPEGMNRVEARVRILRDAMANVREATEQVGKMATVAEPSKVVAVQGPHIGDLVLLGTWHFVAQTGTVLLLTYFLLASGDLFLRRSIAVIPTVRDKKRLVAMSEAIQESISAYLFTVTLINVGTGIAVGVAMALVGMPNPMLWGALAAVLTFIPYAGPAVGILIVAAVGLVSFDTLPAAVAPPLAYLACQTIEGSFVTPYVLSQRFTLNPVVVLLALIFWGSIWGVAGALLAVPMLVMFKIAADHVPSLGVIGEFIEK